MYENRMEMQEQLEQMELDETVRTAEAVETMQENQETLGYASDYDKSEMTDTIKNNSPISPKNAQKNYRNALVKDST